MSNKLDIIAEQIEQLKKSGIMVQINYSIDDLSTNDYKIIKCMEEALIFLKKKFPEMKLPYDIDSLHNERQIVRDVINRMEEEINNA